MTDEWHGARLSGAVGDRPPTPERWHPVEVPGRPKRFAGASAVAYRTTVQDPRERDGDRVMLTFEGCFASARVWANDDLLGDVDTYFLPGRWVIDPPFGESIELVVVCRSPRDRFAGAHGSTDLPESRRVPGIWWGASVDAVPDPCLLDITANPSLDGDLGVIDVSMTVASWEPIAERATISLRPLGFGGGGSMERARVRTDPGGHGSATHRLEIPSPHRWWPTGFGEQDRYAVRVSLGEHDRRTTVGFCAVDREADGLVINGESVPIRGINLLDGDDPSGDVDRAVSLNANLVRSQAMVPPPSFHERCDERGLLVWQDLPLTGPGGYDIERGHDLLEALHRRRSAHPSIVLWGVHDDPRTPLLDGVGRGRTARWRARWRYWRTAFDRSGADRIAEAIHDRPVLAVSGPPGTSPDAWHLYPGWRIGTAKDVDWLLDTFVGSAAFVGEFGAASYGEAPADAAAGFDAAIHNAYVRDRTVATSQAYQASVVRSVAEHLRVRGEPAAVAYALRDVDDAGFGVFDVGGGRKAAADELAYAFEPVQAVLTPPPRPGTTSTLFALNDESDPAVLEVEWSVGSATGETTVRLDPGERLEIGPVDVPADAGTADLQVADGDRVVRNRYRVTD